MLAKANPVLTPGVADPTVTVEMVRAGHIARPTKWQELKLKLGALRAYKLLPTPMNWHRYVLDHLIPISLGGAALDSHNVWPQPKAQARMKDHDESAELRAVRAGGDLIAAQNFFVEHWQAEVIP